MACERVPTTVRTITLIRPKRFRWVYCQLEALRHCFPGSVRHMLEELPESLDETYERILKGINKANREHAHRLLQCLTVAIRPLRVSELAEVLAVDFDTASGSETPKLKTDWRWGDQEDAILSTCSSLITVLDEHDNTSQEGMSQFEDASRVVRHSHSYSSRAVQFSHFSVKEFLTSPRLATSNLDVSRFHILLEPAHTIVARACLATLLRSDDHVNEYDVNGRLPLAHYAAKHWIDHARFEGVSFHIREGMEILFDPDKPYFYAWIWIYDIDVRSHGDYSDLYFFGLTEKSGAAPLYYAALCGFHDLAEHLIDKCSQQVNAIGGCYVSPLAAALRMGHFELAHILYQRGADLDVRGCYERTPLLGASITGDLGIIRWLLRRGADPNAVGVVDMINGWTPLHEAALTGNLDVAQTLLQDNADTNIKNRHGEIPLHSALREAGSNVARLVLPQGVDLNARREDGFTPLHVASMYGRLEVARLLIEHGADIGAKDNRGATPFQVAWRRSEMAELLSENGPK